MILGFLISHIYLDSHCTFCYTSLSKHNNLICVYYLHSNSVIIHVKVFRINCIHIKVQFRINHFKQQQNKQKNKGAKYSYKFTIGSYNTTKEKESSVISSYHDCNCFCLFYIIVCIQLLSLL